MKEYEINEETLFISPYKERSKVYENHRVFLVDKPVNEIMEDSCNYFGSSLEGRQKGTERLIGITYKAPIIVEESKGIIFFPTSSPREKKCSWVSLNNIAKYYFKNKNLFIEFKNGIKIALDVSYGIIDNQILRATRLESVLRSRKGQK